MSTKRPRLRIGLPVRNGAAQLPAAIESLLGQTQGDFELLISDNASTDATEEVCRDWAARDARIRYVRQPRDLGVIRNFAWVLAGAETPFFMWAACDDRWLPGFVEANLRLLDAHPEGVLSVSQVEFVEEDGFVVQTLGALGHEHRLEGGTFALEGSPEENLIDFIERPGTNSRFYGIHRTEVIQRCASDERRYLGRDWIVMARTLRFGTHHEVPQVLLRRGVRGASSNPTRIILEMNPSFVSRRWLPLWPMTRCLLSDRLIPADFRSPARARRLLRILWRKNRAEWRHHRKQLAG